LHSITVRVPKGLTRKASKTEILNLHSNRTQIKERRILKLTAELVPKTAWNQSLAKLLPRSVWDSIRGDIIERNGRKCQICGETEGVMNLHEIWEYDDVSHFQKLNGFILLCTMCHHVKHIGLAGILAREGKLDYSEVMKHFCKVNNCSEKDFEKHVAEAFEIWRRRSEHNWKQDFGEYKEFIRNEKKI